MNTQYDRAGWHEPAAGLRTIAGAMVAQIVAVVFTFLVLLYIVNAKSVDGIQGMAMIIAVGMYAAQIAMVVGIFKFGRQPSPGPGAGAAQVAGVLGIIGLIIASYALFIMVKLMGIGPDSDYEEIRSVMDSAQSLPKIEVAAAVLGFIAMMSMLSGISSTARFLGREDLAGKATNAMVLVVIGAVIWSVIKLGAEPRTISSALMFALMVMTLQIAILIQVQRSANGVADALMSGPTAPLPTARQL